MPINLEQPSPPSEYGGRIKNGRYQIHLDGPDEKPTQFSRVSKVTGMTGDDFHLNEWRNRMTVIGLARRDDLWALAQGLDEADRDGLNSVCAQAQEAAGASRGRNLGSALHGHLERVMRGEETVADVPEHWQGHVRAVLEGLEARGLTPVPSMIEQTVLIEGHDTKLCGTFDLALVDADGVMRLADFKTNSKDIYSMLAYSIQMGAYFNHSRTWCWDTRTAGPRIDFADDYAMLIHVPSEPDGGVRCDFHKIKLREATDEFLAALDVWEVRKRSKRKGFLSEPYEISAGGDEASSSPAPALSPPAEPDRLQAEAPEAASLGEPPSITQTDTPTPDQVVEMLGGELVTVPRLGALKDRVQALIDAGHKDVLKRAWLDNEVVAMKDASTDADLRAIDELLNTVEAEFEMPFLPPDTRPDIPVDALEDRLAVLPQDLAAAVEAGLDQLGGRSMRLDHIGEYASRLDKAEAEHNIRTASVEFALCLIDEAPAKLIVDQFDRPLEKLMEGEAEQAVALAEAVQAGVLDNDLAVVNPAAVGETKSDVLKAGREAAARYGLDVPKSSGDVLADSTLSALALRPVG